MDCRPWQRSQEYRHRMAWSGKNTCRYTDKPENTDTGTGLWQNKESRGDLYILIKIVNPRHLSSEQRKLYEKLRLQRLIRARLLYLMAALEGRMRKDELRRFTDKAQKPSLMRGNWRLSDLPAGGRRTPACSAAWAGGRAYSKLLEMIGVNTLGIDEWTKKELDRLPRVYGTNVNQVYATRRFNQVLIKAGQTRQVQGWICGRGTHLPCYSKRKNTPSARILAKYQVDRGKLLAALSKIRGEMNG